MKVDLSLGDAAAEKSWQEKFAAILSCHHCYAHARLAFVVHEGIDADDTQVPAGSVAPKKTFLCHMRKSHDKVWPHDCVACAIYFCPECGHASTVWNQA